MPGTDGIPFIECITYQNLKRIYEEGDIMNIKYDVDIPTKESCRGGREKGEEALAIEKFLTGSTTNMCFEYETKEEAKRKISTIRKYRIRKHYEKLYSVCRRGNCIYIIRMNQK